MSQFVFVVNEWFPLNIHRKIGFKNYIDSSFVKLRLNHYKDLLETQEKDGYFLPLPYREKYDQRNFLYHINGHLSNFEANNVDLVFALQTS
jgi:hypothetical protein